jgi:hypothetical protein
LTNPFSLSHQAKLYRCVIYWGKWQSTTPAM